MRSGRTVEIDNTDAEGRLVLADGIARAAEDDPDYLIELSTLTGAQMVALGTRVIGAMGEPQWRDRVTAAGNAAGEAVWAMPMPDELRAGLDSPVADLRNVTGERWGGMLVGAAFLADFVPDGLPWVHLDIAGPAFNLGGAHGYTPKGATGAGVRTVLATLAELAGLSLIASARLARCCRRPLAHALRVADHADVVERDRVLARERAGAVGAVDPPPRPLPRCRRRARPSSR